MPAYSSIKKIKDSSERNRVVDKLLLLRSQLDREIPAKTATDTLLLATWNIREFGDNRRTESLRYIAEIVGRFDLVAVQEVSNNLLIFLYKRLYTQYIIMFAKIQVFLRKPTKI